MSSAVLSVLSVGASSKSECPRTIDRLVSRNIEPDIPDIVIRRLPLYVRTLRGLQADDVPNVSSDQLAGLIGVTAAQIRRDLSYFGKFGKQGKGYDTLHLEQAISQILKLDREWDVALAGFGSLGHAIAHYRGFIPSSFNIAAIFDRNPDQLGQTVGGVIVNSDQRISEEVRRLGIEIGIIAVPAVNAQDVANAMIEGGIHALLNYAPTVLKIPPSVQVREIDPIWAMQSMTYYLGSEELGAGR